MKAIYRIIIAIFAAAALAVSCSKDAVPVDEAQAADGGPRVITLSYGASVKSTLDGFTPTFSNGDRIMLSNGSRTEECTVSVAGGKATVTTTLPGVLKAVSPASAAVKTGGDLTYKVSATQNGTFTDAAIATAQNIISSAEFEIQVSILKFYVDKSIKVKSIKVESTQNIATAGSSNLKQITVGNGYSYLHNVADDPQQRLCYAAVLPGVPASGLKFTSNTDTQGTVERQSPASTVTLAANTLYNAFIPYYITIGSQRWGYCNIGAFLPEDYGEYFAWGDVKGQAWNGSSWSDGGFSWAKAPFNNGSSEYDETYFNSHKSTFCPGDVLALQYDAAYVNWRHVWRMPTSQEFKDLYDACGGTSTPKSGGSTSTTEKGVYWCTSYDGVAGLLFVDGGGNKLFFPAAGYGATDLRHADTGYYWSSTWGSADNADWAYYLLFWSGKVNPQDNHLRCIGRTVRPIFEGNSWTMDDYVDGGDI